MIGRSKAHLDAVAETYGQHMRFAGAVGSLMILAGIACLVHALLPALFPDRASGTIRRLHAAIESRAAPEAIFAADEEMDGLLTLLALAMLAALMPWLLGAEAIVAAPVSLFALGFPAAAFYAASSGAEGRSAADAANADRGSLQA